MTDASVLQHRRRASGLDPALELFPAEASPPGRPGASRPNELLQLRRE